MLDAAIRAQTASLLHPSEHLNQEVDEPLGTVHADVGFTLWYPSGSGTPGMSSPWLGAA
jgi:hypothetical protein